MSSLSALFFIVLVSDFFLIAVLVAYLVYATYQIILLHSAPYVPSSDEAMDRMIALSGMHAGMKVLELGSGNGELCIRAAEQGAEAFGIDANPFLVAWSNIRAKRRARYPSAHFETRNFWRMTFPRDTDVVFVYLLPNTMDLLLPKLKTELRPGTIIISNRFPFSQATPVLTDGVVKKYIL